MVTIPVAVEIPPVEAVEATNYDTVAETAAKRPAAWNPVPAVVVPGRPKVSRSGAGRNVGNRSAHINSKLSRIGFRGRKANRAGKNRCTQHQLHRVSHNASVPAGPRSAASICRDRPGSFPVEVFFFLPPGQPVMSYANTAHTKGCGSIRKINLRNFLETSIIKRSLPRGTAVREQGSARNPAVGANP